MGDYEEIPMVVIVWKVVCHIMGNEKEKEDNVLPQALLLFRLVPFQLIDSILSKDVTKVASILSNE